MLKKQMFTKYSNINTHREKEMNISNEKKNDLKMKNFSKIKYKKVCKQAGKILFFPAIKFKQTNQIN